MTDPASITSAERLVLRDALGWLLLSAGGVAIAAQFAPGGPEATGMSEPDGYLAGVWARSFADPYQAGMLAAVFAVPLHFAWTALRRRGPAVGAAYDRFGAWGQTALTSLGFLGTVIGVSMAVAGLETALLEEDPGRLIAGLSTAFDTTFLGLVGALLLMTLRKVGDVGRRA